MKLKVCFVIAIAALFVIGRICIVSSISLLDNAEKRNNFHTPIACVSFRSINSQFANENHLNKSLPKHKNRNSLFKRNFSLNFSGVVKTNHVNFFAYLGNYIGSPRGGHII